jgi:hypothetical protein
MNHSTTFTNDREELKAAWRVLFFEGPPSDATWNRWYTSYGEFAPRMVREVMLKMAYKYKREGMTALQLERLATSILGRIDQERTAAIKKLKADVVERPGYNELADPRAVETEREETQWNR